MSPSRPPDSAARFLPGRRTLAGLREAAAGCTACPLHLTGAQTVFGEGPPDAPLMLVGEQPGDAEDREGRPFVGPAGRLLDKALAEAGVDRDRAFVTNVVKHFKWVARGKRRMHSKPGSLEIRACLPWLEAELETVGPKVLVCLGATAAQALIGRKFKVTESRGSFQQSPLAPYVLATVHPSSLLRAPDEETRRRDYARFVADLRKAAEPLA
jgi:DNA polymerase